MRIRKKAIWAVCLCCLICVSGCAASNVRQQSVPENNHSADEPETDGRMSELSVIEHDAPLKIGDLGVERLLFPSHMRSLGKGHARNASLLDPNGFPLIRAFPNPSIQPIRGNYAENVIETAKSYLRTPYEYGSDRMEPSTFDCSDFTRWVYLYALGMDLPWDSRSQAAYIKAFAGRQYTDLNEARRGDILFFTRFLGPHASDYEGLQPEDKPISHMGIYLGDGKLIHTASKETGGVRIDVIRWKHLEYRFLFGGGVLD
ncbi:hypothetical protein PAESOLCIP111_05014 [Paenibacillus solanacearum]|uniref:NlpC/P60 domain-containing protein n=1 Tax=Paenibacillus solanacearum TaxID=2048548 RepID=A0A916K5B9_9BACL|nr:C40 family peptidase [Paenibacillus solanacearum]CAG7645754.1 hypothetical protein PAESOLCIP111_05014 [Paenibacillus solanacearum]